MTKTLKAKKYEIIQYYKGTTTILEIEMEDDKKYYEIMQMQEQLKIDGIIDLYLVRQVE